MNHVHRGWYAPLHKHFPYIGTVCHRREQPSVRTATPSAAGAAIVRAFVRVVQAGASMTEEDDQSCVVLRQSHGVQHAAHTIDHFRRGESSEQSVIGFRIGFRAVEVEFGSRIGQ